MHINILRFYNFMIINKLIIKRQYARVVKRVDSKSTGFYPHQFKSGCCRIFFYFLFNLKFINLIKYVKYYQFCRIFCLGLIL